MNFLLWSMPLLVLILSFISFKLNIFKSFRYKVYALILFVAFLFDLMHLSFSNDLYDTVRFLFITFVICDILWNVSKVRKLAFRIALLFIGIVAFGWVYINWIMDGPAANGDYWKNAVVNTYVNHKNRTYVLKERFVPARNPKHKILILSKIKKLSILEEEVRSYDMPEGYMNSEFNYKWSNTLNGVRLDLVNNRDTIWTLGEGF